MLLRFVSTPFLPLPVQLVKYCFACQWRPISSLNICNMQITIVCVFSIPFNILSWLAAKRVTNINPLAAEGVFFNNTFWNFHSVMLLVVVVVYSVSNFIRQQTKTNNIPIVLYTVRMKGIRLKWNLLLLHPIYIWYNVSTRK